MITRAAPLCLGCKHYDKVAFEEDAVCQCKAFPDGIPMDIWHNTWDHRKIYKDENYLFEPINKESEEYAELLFS